MKKGITLITLIVMVVVMMILATTVTITGVDAMNNSKKMKFATELLFMQETIDNYITEHSGNLPITGTEITNENLPDGEYYEIDTSLLGLIETTYGRKLNNDTTDIYVVSKSNNIVYYFKGLKIGNTMYYTLNDELKNIINYTDTKIFSKDGIIFTPSEINYTNQEINVKVQIPIEYSGVSVLSQNVQITDFTTVDEYNVYNISKTSNFDIVVSYTRDNKSLKQVYTVSNYDGEAPSIEIIDTTILNNNDKKTSITIATSDNLSGVSKVLYEEDNVEKSYFEIENKGKEVRNNNVVVDKFTKYVTFYVVDKAGNSQILLETLNATASVDDYVKYGLITHLDAINNTENITSTSTTVWKDLSGNGNHGIINNMDGTQASGWNSNCLTLDGVDDYVDLGLVNYDFEKGITMSATINFSVFGNNSIFGNWQSGGGGIGIRTSDQKLFVNFCTDETSVYNYAINPNVTELGKDYSIVGTYDGKEIVLYINGEFVIRNELIGNLTPSLAPIVLGANPSINTSNHSSFTSFNVKNAKIYNRALTESEIKQNYMVDQIRFGI